MAGGRRPGPVLLVVRDGWGRNPNPEHRAFDAVHLARTPIADRLLREFPWTTLDTSGEAVGLPAGTMGNSEVGHQNLGAGRVVDQESVRITRAIRSQSFFENSILVQAVERAQTEGAAVHLLGIASDAGVHGLITHLEACLELCRRRAIERVFVHLFTDGRDTGPFTGVDYVAQVEASCRELGVGQVASIVGRYWAMDRDNRWHRIERAYDLLVGRGAALEALPRFPSAVDAVRDYYDAPEDGRAGDEFVTPRLVADGPSAARHGRIAAGDTVIFVNYRGDRPRELVRAFVLDDFYGHVAESPEDGARGFDRGPRLPVHFVTMTAYEQALDPYVEVAFPKPPKMDDIAGTYLARLGLRQFRCAETEKFPHVTFFFNDYRDPPLVGERRAMAQSPDVATYDLKPEMSAAEVRDLALERLAADDCEDFLLVNFANADMVGHTGSLDAAIRAVETVDTCVGDLIAAMLERGGRAIVTADHGNAEQMWDPATDAPHTAHTLYPVDCIIVDEALKALASGTADAPSSGLRPEGVLADVFPTILVLLGLPCPGAMTGRSLIASD
ncbi:MAG: 2,3-bisphosphoglycerate-independent phosphoglycerate mutase [Acidobacteriota bacterium]